MADKHHLTEDEKVLHNMGYAQELARRMGRFSNFAISFSIICILAGGITAFPVAMSSGGGFSVSIGWVVGSACSRSSLQLRSGRSLRPTRQLAAFITGPPFSAVAAGAGCAPGSTSSASSSSSPR